MRNYAAQSAEHGASQPDSIARQGDLTLCTHTKAQSITRHWALTKRYYPYILLHATSDGT